MSQSIENKKGPGGYAWVVVGLLWVVALLNYLDRQVLSTMQQSIAVDIHALKDSENFGFLMALFLWIYGAMSPVGGMIADRVNRKMLIVVSLAVWSAVTLAMGFAQNFDQLLVLRALMGVSEALYIPTGLALIADYHTGKTRSLAVGIHMTGLYLGQALGGFGATIAEHLNWKQTFWTLGGIGIAYGLVLLAFLKEKKHDAKPENEQVNSSEEALVTNTQTQGKGFASVMHSLATLLTMVPFWVLMLYFASLSLPGWGTKNWLPTLFSQNFGKPMSEAGPMATITISASCFIGVFIGGFLSDRWVQSNVRGRIFTSALGTFLTIPGLLLIGFGKDLGVDPVIAIVSGAALYGIGFGIFDGNNMPILCQFVSRKYRAAGYGFMNLMGLGAGALVTKMMGKSANDGNLGTPFAIMAIGVTVALIAFLCLRPKTVDMQ